MDIFGNEIKTVTIDGIEFTPLIDYEIVSSFLLVSKCGLVYNLKTGKYLKPSESYRSTKANGDFKGMRLNFSTEGQPYWDRGMKYPACDKKGKLIKRKMHLHQAVLQSWKPYRTTVLESLSREELIELAMEACLIDHFDDNARNNHIDNLRYSTPLRNANFRKKWENEPMDKS